MWIYDQQTLAFLEVNQVAPDRYGYSRQEFLQMTILDICPAEDIPQILKSTLHPNERVPLDLSGSRHMNRKEKSSKSGLAIRKSCFMAAPQLSSSSTVPVSNRVFAQAEAIAFIVDRAVGLNASSASADS